MKRNYLLFLDDISNRIKKIVWNVATKKLPTIKNQIDDIIEQLS